MNLEVGITKRAHLRPVKALDFHLGRDTERSDQITNFEPYISHGKPKDRDGARIDHLHDRLPEVAIEETSNPVRAVQLHHPLPDNAVPTGTILSGCKYTDRQHSPETVHTVNGNRAYRIVDTSPFPEEDTYDNQPTRH